MSRTPIKMVSNEPIEFIPEEYKDLDPKAEKIADRPLVFVGKRMTRDQKFALQELMKFKYPEGVTFDTPEEFQKAVEITGRGDAYKYIWDHCITEIKNVLLLDPKDNKVVEYDVLKGKDRDKLWNTEGEDANILQAVAFFMDTSKFTEEESKN